MLSELRLDEASVVCKSEMSDDDFSLFRSMIYKSIGINMPPAKKLMLSSRLNKRLRELGMESYREYYNYLNSSEGLSKEYQNMVDVVTTNKTDFFREAVHFKMLSGVVLPHLLAGERFRQGNRINIWSAGCSTGEEPYSIAMTASEFFSSGIGAFTIYATDISTKVLCHAVNAVYSEELVKPVPEHMIKKYVMKGKGEKEGYVRMVPQIRNSVRFAKLNLMDERFKLGASMDVVFCRNVIIYFDRPTQRELFRKIYDVVTPGGYLFIGSSESLFGINESFVSVGPSVYRKPG